MNVGRRLAVGDQVNGSAEAAQMLANGGAKRGGKLADPAGETRSSRLPMVSAIAAVSRAMLEQVDRLFGVAIVVCNLRISEDRPDTPRRPDS